MLAAIGPFVDNHAALDPPRDKAEKSLVYECGEMEILLAKT